MFEVRQINATSFCLCSVGYQWKRQRFISRYIRGLYYTWKGFQKRHDPKWKRFYLTKQILIDADIALLRVFDCFMDSGSQVILQLYIMLRLGSTSMKCNILVYSRSNYFYFIVYF
jgi:hypothetical protein